MEASLEGPKNIERAGNRSVYIVLCGQEPVMEKGSSVKMAELEKLQPGIVESFGPNSLMQTIGRAAGIIDRNELNNADIIIPSGKRRGESKPGEEMKEPTEAKAMAEVARMVYGAFDPIKKTRELNAQLEPETEARNTIWNFINSANMIDRKNPGRSLEQIAQDSYFIVAHFQVPRAKMIAKLMGFDPNHVISAEQVYYDQAKADEARTMKLDGEKIDKDDFILSKAKQDWLQARVGNTNVTYIIPDNPAKLDEHYVTEMTYHQRKTIRAEVTRRKLIDQLIHENPNLNRKKLEKDLFIFEGKDMQTRMKEERRWARGLVEVPEYYMVSLGANIRSDERLMYFLRQYQEFNPTIFDRLVDKSTLSDPNKWPIENPTYLKMDLTLSPDEIRKQLGNAHWAWQAVNGGWEAEEYPREVTQRFLELGIPDEDIGYLSRAEVPPLKENL